MFRSTSFRYVIWRLGLAGLLLVSVTVFMSALSAPSGATTPSGVHVYGWGFKGPEALAVSGSDLFVANYYGNSVTELNASTGALVRVISASSYRFNHP